MLASMDSQELTGWMALFGVHQEEAEHQRDIEESGDGIVHVAGVDPDHDTTDEEDDEPDGSTE